MPAVDNLTTVDLLVRAATIHTFDGAGSGLASIAVRDGLIVALSAEPDGLDGLVGASTRCVDASSATVLPGFFDTHNHMLHAALDSGAVQLAGCTSIDDVIHAIGAHAAATEHGQWIVPSKAWHESNLAERRLPTCVELDRASSTHPIALRRGGHVMVANSMALRLAGLDDTTPDPAGGTLERDDSGKLTGTLIERPAFAPISRLLPVIERKQWAERLRAQCQAYNARGITAVRDPGIYRDELLVYQDARDRDWLTVRSDVMIRLDPGLGYDGMRAELARWDARTNLGDSKLRLHGVKVFLDGGIEGAAMSDDYANQPGYKGHLFLEVDQLAELVDIAVGRGWRVGCHAVGDRAVSTAVDAYSRIIARYPDLPAGWLVIEHAFLADVHLRNRVIDLGIAVTVQHPLLWFLGANMVKYWGVERTDDSFPVREWVDAGALISAGSDCNVAPFDPLLSIWGLCTRGTAGSGVRGKGHGIDRQTAFELYTVAGAHLLGDPRRGGLATGRHADLIVFDEDPLTCDIDRLPTLEPSMTVLGGRIVHRSDTTSVDEKPYSPRERNNDG